MKFQYEDIFIKKTNLCKYKKGKKIKNSILLDERSNNNIPGKGEYRFITKGKIFSKFN